MSDTKVTTNRFKLARTVHNQHGKQSVNDVKKATGIQTSLINDIETDAPVTPRGVSYLVVKKLAQHYGVSADYLLGLSDVPSPNTDLQAVCAYTGLSSAAIENLQDINSRISLRKQVNMLLSNEHFCRLIESFQLMDFSRKLYEKGLTDDNYFEMYMASAKKLPPNFYDDDDIEASPDDSDAVAGAVQAIKRDAEFSRYELIKMFEQLVDKMFGDLDYNLVIERVWHEGMLQRERERDRTNSK